MVYLVYLQVLCLILGLTQAALTPSEPFIGSVSLVDNDIYHLFWNFNSTTITFEVHAKVKGWVGFGISPNGGMPGSDIVIGWVDNGVPYFNDRYATSQSMPVIDDHQDWTLLAANETTTHTVLKFMRPLSLCDEDDRSITDGTMRIIFAYSDSDPSSETNVMYHNSKRGSKSVQFLTLTAANAPGLPLDAFHVDFLNNNVTIPHTSDTTYWCEGYVAPNMPGKNHIIRVEPIIQSGNEAFVHHILLYACFHKPTNISLVLDKTGFVCFMPNMPWEECFAPIVGWAVGGKGYDYPIHAGMPFGEIANKVLYLKMETHYDNPSLIQGVKDASGLRLWFTPTLRQYDAGVLELGMPVNPFTHILPGGYKAFLNHGHCAKECLIDAMGDTVPEIKIFASDLHSHLLGRALRIRHFRNGVEMPTLDEDMTYDFNLQETRVVSPEVTVSKGDNLLVECIYDTSKKNYTTLAGLGTLYEMCIVYLHYYPALPTISTCNSAPTQAQLAAGLNLKYIPYNAEELREFGEFALLTDYENTPVSNYLENLGMFGDEATKAKYQKAVISGKIQLGCGKGINRLNSDKKIIEVPEITSPYTAPCTCGTCSGASTNIKIFTPVIYMALLVSTIIYKISL